MFFDLMGGPETPIYNDRKQVIEYRAPYDSHFKETFDISLKNDNLNRFSVFELKKWIEKNIRGSWRMEFFTPYADHNYGHIYFSRKEDAVAYKLRWQ